ncbi:MAG: hypothetical protein PVJ33_16415 [Lysobacterales bacterium]|jgi:hypothetical protein
MFNRIVTGLALAATCCLAAGAATTAVAGDPGMVVLAMGGGSIDDALFNPNSPIAAEATFSLHAGYDKHGEFKGHFSFKRVYPGHGVRAVISSEITEMDWGFDECSWVRMSGEMTLHATWVNQPIRPEYFTVEAWDCDGVPGASDMIWFGTYRDEARTNMRPALTLVESAELSGGNIMIR